MGEKPRRNGCGTESQEGDTSDLGDKRTSVGPQSVGADKLAVQETEEVHGTAFVIQQGGHADWLNLFWFNGKNRNLNLAERTGIFLQKAILTKKVVRYRDKIQKN